MCLFKIIGLTWRWCWWLVVQPDQAVAGSGDEEEVSVKMSVPLPLIGHLIGKAGSNIKDLQKSGVLVKILQVPTTQPLSGRL